MERRVFVFLFIALAAAAWIFFQGWKSLDRLFGARDAVQDGFRQEDNVRRKEDTLLVDLRGGEYSVSWFKVNDVSKLTLFPNFEERMSAREAKKSHNCKSLVNGGFYSKEHKPIGLFVSEGKTLSMQTDNYLFNGVFGVGKDGSVEITDGRVREQMRFAVQAGPILIKDGIVREIKDISGSGERRTVVALTQTDEVYFFEVYKPESAYLGPTLSDMPEIVRLIGEKSGIKITNALNLDGGSASAFLTDSVSLGELSPIGSYFCLSR